MANSERDRAELKTWVTNGDVSASGFCKPCRSHFCPHVKPGMYSDEERQSYLDAIVAWHIEKPARGDEQH